MISNILYLILFGLILASVGSFLFNQGFLFLSLWNDFEKQHKHDVFTLYSICFNDDVKFSMGEKNSDFCREIEERILLNPSTHAIKEVLNQTYICGSHSCMSYIKEALGSLDWKILVSIIVLIPLFYKLFGFRKSTASNFQRINAGIPYYRLPPEIQYEINR